MAITKDAIGRERLRCPRCDGVSRIKPHPDEVLIPQGLVRASASEALPPVKPGQLRCQRCAKGVDGDQRFHPECARARAAERKQRPCPDCGAAFTPTQASYARCASCKAKRVARPQLCTGCNRLNAGVRGPRVVSSCKHCRPGPRSHRSYRPKPCAKCGTHFAPTGPRAYYCEACR